MILMRKKYRSSVVQPCLNISKNVLIFSDSAEPRIEELCYKDNSDIGKRLKKCRIRFENTIKNEADKYLSILHIVLTFLYFVSVVYNDFEKPYKL